MSIPAYDDFETRSPVDLKKEGLYNYSTHPLTEVMCMAFAMGDGEVVVWWPGDPDPTYLLDHVDNGGEFVAHNAPFEIAIWNRIMVPRFKWPKLDPRQVVCTMARCYAMSLPGALENGAAALGLHVAKDTDGRALMMRMCQPTNKKEVVLGLPPKYVTDRERFTFMGQKVTPAWAYKRLGAYCASDVDVERAIYRRTRPLSDYERRVWVLDWKINNRGILFDQPAIKGGLAIKDQTVAQLDAEMHRVTDGHVSVCTNVLALKNWISDFGVMNDSLAKVELDDLLDADNLPGPVRAGLELRKEAGRATSVAKLESINLFSGADGRVRNLIQYCGAGSTGRFAGRGPQPHNFTRDLPKPAVVEAVMQLIRDRDAELIDMLYGPPLTQISKLLRGLIIAGPGRKLIGGDWSNVEGRGVAWLAGEEWKLAVFRECDVNPDMPDVYEQSYAKSYGIDPATVTGDQRQIGKVRELALGYGGGVGAFQTMAATYGVRVSDERAEQEKVSWRNDHPRIKGYWKQLQKSAIRAVQNPGVITVAGAPGRQVKFKKVGSFLYMLLPSQRALCYPYPEIRIGDYGPYLTYKTVPSQDEWKRGRIIDDHKNSRLWARVATYGGKLAENATQAICRDILVDAMLRIDEKGIAIVLHIHDEIVAEGRFTERHKSLIQDIMVTPPIWARDFPLAAECWIADRYQK